MVRRVRRDELSEIAQRSGFDLTPHEVDEYLIILNDMFDTLSDIEGRLPELLLPADDTAVSRDPGRSPSPGEDPLNAVIRWCSVKGETSGTLSGKRFGLKDNIAVAGFPMTAGSNVLENYVPEQDATVVTRLIEAGAEIAAILNLEDFAWSGGGETSAFGPVLNPFDLTRTAAGSSGGSAAALFYDDIDVTLGTDQGGSVRIPASWCGVLGLKPSRGVVPYTGALSIEHTADYLRPLSRNVIDMAVTMDVISGPDRWDPRQAGVPSLPGFAKVVDNAPETLGGITIGVLREGFLFEHEPNTADGTLETAQAVRGCVERFRSLGAGVVDVSVPEHELGGLIQFPAFVEAQNALLWGFGNGYQVGGRYSPALARAMGEGMELRADLLPPTIKSILIIGNYLRERYFSWYHAVAKNYMPRLTAAYDRVLSDVDYLLMPTAAFYAHKARPDASVSERVLRGWAMVTNTGQFNMSGHPALSLPAAEADGLPVGVMLVAGQLKDAALLSVARTYERAHGWLPDWQGWEKRAAVTGSRCDRPWGLLAGELWLALLEECGERLSMIGGGQHCGLDLRSLGEMVVE